MANKADLQEWVMAALLDMNGEAHLARTCEHIWQHHEPELRKSGDLFFTWQYDMRWAGQYLQKAGKLVKLSRTWKLTK